MLFECVTPTFDAIKESKAKWSNVNSEPLLQNLRGFQVLQLVMNVLVEVDLLLELLQLRILKKRRYELHFEHNHES